jgi:hypothetical protein
MASDPGAFLRLKAAIDATLAGTEAKSTAARALAERYAAFRAGAARLADESGERDEFDGLFPPAAPSTSRSGGGPRVSQQAMEDAHAAYALLSGLSGWLNGHAEQVQLDAEARAYSEARQRNEGRA